MTSRAIYLRLGQLTRLTGKPWAQVPLTALGSRAGAGLSPLLEQARDNNPLVQTEMLDSARNVRETGTQVIDGVKTTGYTGTYPVSAGLARLPAVQRAAVAAQLRAQGITTEQVTVWIDARHQTRKMTGILHGRSESIRFAMLVTGLIRPVTVTLPPTDQVATVPASVLAG